MIKEEYGTLATNVPNVNVIGVVPVHGKTHSPLRLSCDECHLVSKEELGSAIVITYNSFCPLQLGELQEWRC